MKASDIANRLKAVLPLYTNDFSDVINITSLSKSGSIITATTALNHSLTTGRHVTIFGVEQKLNIDTIVLTNGLVTVTTTDPHYLSDPQFYSSENTPYVKLSGNLPSEYNGIFKLKNVIDELNFTFYLNTSNNPTSTGYLILEDNVYNGYHQITVTSSTGFTFINDLEAYEATGSIQMSYGSRIAYAATPERAAQFYSEDKSRVMQKWLFAVLGSDASFKNNIVASDISSAKRSGESYQLDNQQDFSIFCFIPCANDLLGGDASDNARSYRSFLLKCLSNYRFDSDLSELKLEPVNYIGSETEDYNNATYVHRFDFSTKGYINDSDVSQDFSVPLKRIEIDHQRFDTKISF